MKPATFIPCYVSMFPKLCEVARNLGYALAVHGSVQRDFDLIACPWIEGAAEPEVLVQAICDAAGGFIIPDGTRGGRSDGKGGFVEAIIEQPSKKPYGRLAWNIHLGEAPVIDLSVMPLR